MKKLYIAASLFTGLFFHSIAKAQQISLTTPNGTYSENFDGMGASGTTFPAGWSAIRYAGSGTLNQALTLSVTDGAATSGAVYNVGSATAPANADRALGTLASGTTAPAFGASFVNNTGSVISTLSITAFSEQWRTGGNALVETVVFEYSTDATSLSTGTWTPVSSLNLVEILTASTTSAAVDGNANRVAISGTLSAVNLVSGGTLWLRWRDADNTGTDGLYALDDFSATWSNTALAKNVSVAATTNAAEPSTSGVATLSLTAPAPASGVTVTYTLSGTAVAGTDYSNPQNGTITIPQGSSTATITFPVIDDNVSEPTETIIVTLASVDNGYSISTGTATITLADNESSSLYSYDFSACTGALSDGFTQQSVTGAQVWSCTTFGRSGNAVQMNGFATTSQENVDWLISPAINLSSTNIPLLSFYSRSAFNGEGLRLYITTNYTGDVTTTTWTELNGQFPAAGSDVWTLSSNINLSAYKQANVRFAFRYASTTSASSRWTVDDISIINSSVPPPPSLSVANTMLDFKYVAAGDIYIGKTFSFAGNNMTSPLTVTAPDNFTLSKNGFTYSKSITYSVSELNAGQKTVFAGYMPTAANKVNAGLVSFSATGLNQQAVFLKGNTYPQATTLNVVNWNVEWFGGAQGPSDNDLQEANVRQAMEFLGADVFALEEVVDTARLGRMIRSLSGGYAYVVSDYGSNAPTPSDPDYASAQKLALVYKTSVLSNVSARGLMKSSSSANSSWASGRVPFLVNATATKNAATKSISFIVVHGKAGDTQSDYQSRQAGVAELKDTLNAQFSTRNVIILGDFNDDLDRSIYTGSGPVLSSYDALIKDSVDADSYKSLSLLLSQYGLNSTTDFSDVIDHVVVSNEMAPSYLPLSVSLYNDIADLAGISDYGNTTTDHYPVQTRYLLTEASGGPLPVRLTEFSASKQAGTVALRWMTALEINTKEFVVERSADGVNFKALATVSARGAGNGAAYATVDASPVSGNSYYRLRTVDNDGYTEFSRIVKINFAKAFTLSLSPNPAKGAVLVSLSNITEPLLLTLSDISGRRVKEQLLTQPLSTVRLDGLTKGIYLVTLKGKTEVYTEKLIIE